MRGHPLLCTFGRLRASPVGLHAHSPDLPQRAHPAISERAHSATQAEWARIITVKCLNLLQKQRKFRFLDLWPIGLETQKSPFGHTGRMGSNHIFLKFWSRLGSFEAEWARIRGRMGSKPNGLAEKQLSISEKNVWISDGFLDPKLQFLLLQIAQ